MQGANILTTLLQHPSSTIHAFSRRPLPAHLTSSKPHFHTVIASDSSTWPGEISRLAPTPSIFISALGTTRGQAGSFAAQRAIDLELNLALAKAAQEAGAKIYVLISSGGANSSSIAPYTKMKGQLEDAVQELGYEKVVILRPGLILGTRRQEDSRPPEAAFRYLARGLRAVFGGYGVDWWTNDAEAIAQAAVEAGLRALEGGKDVPADKTWIVGIKDILRLAKESQARGN